jgi:nitrate/nitrite transporter NarK
MSYESVNPATGALVKTIAPIDDRDLEGVLVTADNTFKSDWRKRSVADRARIISRRRAVGGIVSPIFVGWTRELTGSFYGALGVLGGTFCLSMIVLYGCTSPSSRVRRREQRVIGTSHRVE